MSKSRQSSSAPSQRQLRVGELVRHRLAEMLTRGDIHDDVIGTRVISISEVRMTADLRLATVYIMPLGGDGAEEVLEAFERNTRFIRGAVAKAVNLKFAPDVRFRLDESFAEARRMDAILDSPSVRRDTRKEE